MNPLDDRALAEDLVRRSSSGTPVQRTSRSERLAQAVHARVAAVPQDKPRPSVPGFRWLDGLAPRRQLGATFGAVALIVALASIGLLSGFGSRPASPVARSDWHLTTNELVAVVAEAKATGANVGKTIIADAAVRWTQDMRAVPCAAGPGLSCGDPCEVCIAYLYTGNSSVPPIRVWGMPRDGRPVDAGPGSYALRIEGDESVTFVGRATLIRNGAWAFDDFAGVLRGIESTLPVVQTLYPVNAFLTLPNSAPSCAFPGLDPRFGCGRPAWLIARSADSRSVAGTGPPPNAIRVQNELTPSDEPGASAAPDRAVYLLRPVAPMPADCFLCGDIGTAQVVAQLDPIAIPVAPTAPPTASPAPPTSIPDPTPAVGADAVRILTGVELEQLVGSESAAARNAGRVVVVDAQIAMWLTDCASPPCPDLYTLFAVGIDGRGSNPRIAVDVGEFGAVSAGTAPPLALRIVGMNSVELVAHVAAGSSPIGAGSLSDYKTWAELQRMTRPAPTDPVVVPTAYLVDAWLESQWNPRACGPSNPAVTTPPRLTDFRCPAWAWLSAAPAYLTTDHLAPPPDSLRVQDAAYSDFAPDPAIEGSPRTATPRQAIYLITPTWSGLSPATPGEAQAPDAASILGRVDPMQPTELAPTPAPTALSAHAQTSLGLFRLTLDLPKTTWSSTESIGGTARLEYTGTGPFGLSGSIGGPLGFGLASIGGPYVLGPVYDDACHAQTIRPGFSLSAPLRKDGGYDADSPLASFYAGFFADPLYRLPPGDWDVSAWADFGVGSTDCGGPEYRMKATVRIHVEP